MKRLFDIFASGVGLVVLSPLFLIVAVWIKLDSTGPVFYRQVRVGKGNQDFKIFKFRTMRIGSDRGSLITVGGRDPRITTSGYFLRKTKIDELPQLINVLKGDMSFIGPRPLYVNFLKLYDDTQARSYQVRPGISGWAQVHGRNLCTYSKKFEYDVWYVDHISAWVDLQILFLTIKNVVCREDIGVGSGNNDEVDDLGFTQRLKDMGLREE